MERDDLDRFQQKLLDRRDALIAEGDIVIDPVVRDPATKVDEDEAPLTEMSQVIASRRNKERAQEIQGIQLALRRLELDPDDFGVCEHCHEDIDLRRLEIMPWSRFCVKCQSKLADEARGGRRKHLTDYKG